MQEIELKNEKLLADEGILSPQREAELQGRLAALESKYDSLVSQNSALLDENAELKQQLTNLKKLVYGQKSEKTEVILENGEQLCVFNEAEEQANKQVREREKDVIVPEHKRKSKRTHEEAFENLPVEEVIHAVEDKECPDCGEQMETIGKEFVRDELVYVPARLFVRKHYAEVVKCPVCGEDEAQDASFSDVPAPVFKKAVVSEPMIPHSFCSPELLAHILYEKYAMAVPLERQSKDLRAMGMTISTATLSNWVIHAAERFFAPIYERMKNELLTCSVIHADETVVQVLSEPGRLAKTESRMWVYCAGKYETHSNILFEYTPTQNGDHARKFLGDFGKYLVCDGYDGYGKLPNVTRCGCWAHARRKFVEALPLDKALVEGSAAAKTLEFCNKIFILERIFEGHGEGNRKLMPEERYINRQKHSKPILDEFFSWLSELHPAGGTKLARAVQYCLNEKAYLYRFWENGSIPVDNNRAENAIRPFVAGRKNWLFSVSPKGARASAILYSIAATACANGLSIEEYFTRVLRAHGTELLLPR